MELKAASVASYYHTNITSMSRATFARRRKKTGKRCWANKGCLKQSSCEAPPHRSRTVAAMLLTSATAGASAPPNDSHRGHSRLRYYFNTLPRSGSSRPCTCPHPWPWCLHQHSRCTGRHTIHKTHRFSTRKRWSPISRTAKKNSFVCAIIFKSLPVYDAPIDTAIESGTSAI